MKNSCGLNREMKKKSAYNGRHSAHLIERTWRRKISTLFLTSTDFCWEYFKLCRSFGSIVKSSTIMIVSMYFFYLKKKIVTSKSSFLASVPSISPETSTNRDSFLWKLYCADTINAQAIIGTNTATTAPVMINWYVEVISLSIVSNIAQPMRETQ